MAIRSLHHGAQVLLGALLALGLVAGLGEGYLRGFPPADLRPYLGDASGLAGPFAPDDRYGVGYRSWDALAGDYRERLAEYLPFDAPPDPRPRWALFGNSFVQAAGMLGDTASRGVPDRKMFFLRRNEPLYVRLAQAEVLLDHGLRPERLIVEMMPLDVVALAQHPLAELSVTSQGAITYRAPVAASRLALTAWVRATESLRQPNRVAKQMFAGLNADTRGDLERLFAAFADAARRHSVPATVLLIPTHEQVCRGASCGFQDELAELCGRLDLDVCDARRPFLTAADKPALFIPDKHFSERGNRLLLDELLGHFRGRGMALSVRGNPPTEIGP